MQTFVPYPSFGRCARVLDPRRLGKQRVEVLQILRALELEEYGWQSHPAVLMWRGYTEALVCYGAAIVAEWTRRGFADSCLSQILEFAPSSRSQRELARAGELPPWIGGRALHRSHRSALVRKDPDFYGPRFPGVPGDLPYVWPPPTRDAPALAPFSAWVLRTDGLDLGGVITLPRLERGVRPTSKPARQVRAFLEQAQVGDPIVALAGDALVAGEITGEPSTRRNAHARDVRWIGPIAREALRVPARLQDPRRFFALRGERDPRLLAARRAR